MSDVFVPSAFGRAGVTPTVGVGTPLYVVRATYRHPVTGADTALPPHHFVLVEEMASTIVVVGTRSDASGNAVVNAVADPGTGPFLLTFVPADQDVRNYMIDHDEAWIDLDTNEWAKPQPDRGRVERRNLYRIPAWTTRRKARRGGGFKDWPTDASASSKEHGLLERADVFQKPYGTLAKPWDVPIDFGWPLVTVRFFYFDWGRDKQNTLPPGLFVDAIPAWDNQIGRMGSGVAVKDGDGAARMMIEATTKHFPAIHFQWRSPRPGFLRVDLVAGEPAAGAKDARLVVDDPLPPERERRNLLPDAWHSHGQLGKITATSKTFPRERWIIAGTNLDGGQDKDITLEFHLDDVVMTDPKIETGTSYHGVPTLFDHFLGIIDPKPSRPHLTDLDLTLSSLEAARVYKIGAPLPAGRKRVDMATRLIHLDGAFFDLRDERVTGTPGKTVSLGSRKAVKGQHRSVDYGSSGGGNPKLENEGFYELHFIDTPGTVDPIAGKPLDHLLLYVSMKLDPGSVPSTLIDSFYQAYTAAAERWSQGSPGVPGPTKDYRLVSQDMAKRDHLVRVRAYFGEVVDESAIMNINLAEGERSNAGDSPLGRYLRFIVSPAMEYYTSSIAGDTGAPANESEDSDHVKRGWHTLAHELGHVLGLPDEYGEELSPSSVDPAATVQNPRVAGYNPPKEGMPTDYRPFFSDRFAIMSQNTLPRLRHFHHHVEAFNTEGAFAGLPGAPFRLRHETLGGGLEYVRPIDAHKHPYTAEFDGVAIPGGKGDCALFPVGQDEGVAEAMFVQPGTAVPVPLAAADRFDALLVVRSKIRFRFGSKIAKPDRWRLIWQQFVSQIYDDMHRSRIRFCLVGGSRLSRIAILIQPSCDEGIAPMTSDDFKLVIDTASPPPPDPFAKGTVDASLDIDVSHFNTNVILRAVLGTTTREVPPPPIPPAPPLPARANVGTLKSIDFASLVALCDAKLGDPPGTRRVVAF